MIGNQLRSPRIKGRINSRHTGLSGDTSGDDDNFGASKSLLDAVDTVSTSIYTFSFTKDLLVLLETLDGRVGVDVGNVSGNTGSTSDVVEGKASNTRVLLEEERHGLTDTTYSHRNETGGAHRCRDWFRMNGDGHKSKGQGKRKGRAS